MIKLLKFSSPNCRPCALLAKYLPEVIQETGAELVSYNLDDHEEEFSRYGIRAAPTLIFLKNDVEILRKVGIVPKQTLIDLINQNK